MFPTQLKGVIIMAEVIAFAVQKGGTGKTSSTNITAEILHSRGYKVLVIDLDPQHNLSHSVGVDDPHLTVTDVLTKKADIKSAILKTKAGYAILPAGRSLFEHQADIKADTLSSALSPLKSYFDYILVDCPPALSSLSINGLVAADKVIIPVICGNFCDIASVDTLNTIDTLKQNGTKVTAAGILVILYNNRSNLDKFMLGKYNEIASKYSTKVFDAKIRQCQKIKEAQVLGQSILQYAPKSNAVTDYTAFVDELIR